jgi:hypothetical protein
MPQQSKRRRRVIQVLILCLTALATTVFVFAALVRSAEAANYKMVACAGNNGVPGYRTETNTVNSAHPNGIFEFHNWCGGAGGDPPGEHAFLRINENQSAGSAGHNAYGRMLWSTPNYVHFKSAGGYTREAYAFNTGWRARFWIVDFANRGIQTLTQGAGLPNSGTQWAITRNFAPHLWPFSSYLDFHTFVYELQCVRSIGCDRTNYNSTDANGFVFVLSDDSLSQVRFTNTAAPPLSGQWVRGTQGITWDASDLGSGLRFERLRVDGALLHQIDYQAAGQCNTASSQVNGEWARAFQPCPTGGPWGRSYALDTASLPDGRHRLTVCTQDFGQYQGLGATGSETCDARSINVDNTAPGQPAALSVTSANKARYLDRFGARWALPPNQGSPIARVHYEVIGPDDRVVVPERVVPGTNLKSLSEIQGPEHPGDYRLRLWLEDSVGLTGPAAVAQIPHDTVPPAAPQDVSVTPPATSRADDGFDLRWRNIADDGSPIAAAHYEVLDAAGNVVVPVRTVSGERLEAISNLDAPDERGAHTLRLWLSDAEGNVGAAVNAPLAYECVRSPGTAGTALSAGLGSYGARSLVVREGSGSTLRGSLRGDVVAGASLCVFSRVITDAGRDFLGIAVAGRGGGYEFPLAPGPSRDLSVLYRSDHRELSSEATVHTIVRPTFTAARRVVYNKQFGRFKGRIPGPHNDRVVIVLQVRQGKGWLAFRRYRTRDDGRYNLAYRFRRTYRPTRYVMRAQVRHTVGYPYLQGNSRRLTLTVLPNRPPSGKHVRRR